MLTSAAPRDADIDIASRLEVVVVTIDQVICPVDLSPASANALRHAAAWARWYEASLRVLYVSPLPQVLVGGTGQSVVLPMPPLDTVRADVERFVEATVPNAPLPTVDILEGHAVTVILEEAARQPHALLVMGTHGATGLDRVLLGSTTERVAHGTACPLLVVPPREAAGPNPGIDLSRILCAIDFQPSSLAGLRYALSLAQEGRARLELATVLEPPRRGEAMVFRPHVPADEWSRRTELLTALRERVPEDARQWALINEQVLTGSPADALLAYAGDIDAELIVIGTGDRPHLHALWLGSTTGRIIRSARCPVLIVPGPRRLSFAHAKPLPRADWEGELDRLSLAYQGEPATMAIMRDDLGMQRQVSGMPLEGVTVDLHHGEREVSVMLARPDGTRLTHVIVDPQDLRLAERFDQHAVELYIVGRDGTATLLGLSSHQR